MQAPSTMRVTDLAVGVDLDRPAAPLGLLLELPLLGGELLRQPLGAALVGLVGEVGAVRAAALDELGRGPGENSWASVAEDARPRAGEERHVEHPGARLRRGLRTRSTRADLQGAGSSPVHVSWGQDGFMGGRSDSVDDVRDDATRRSIFAPRCRMIECEPSRTSSACTAMTPSIVEGGDSRRRAFR